MRRDPSQAAALAWVESPLQLLNVLEWAHHHQVGLAVEFRRDASMSAMIDYCRPLLEDGRFQFRVRVGTGRPKLAQWVIGDTFSGRVQTRILLGSCPQVIVDDGLATLRQLRLLAAATTADFIRSRVRRTGLRAALGNQTRRALNAQAAQVGIELFTALPVSAELTASLAELGYVLTPNRYAWSSAQPQAGPSLAAVVIGSANAADGLIEPERYFAWVAERVRDWQQPARPVWYIPHRREVGPFLARVSAVSGLVVHRPEAPVEMALAGLQPGSQVACLPSTPALTMAPLLADRGVQLSVAAIPANWWRPGSERYRADLRELGW